jgi:hypothetical protein
MDDKIIVQLDQNALIEETEKSIQSNLQNLEEEEKKPLEERVISKEWRVRKNAFLEVFQKLSSNFHIDTKFYTKYDFVYQKLFDETNPNCQEHGVDIIKLIIEKFNIEDTMKIDFFKQIVEKLCLSQKSQCKNKAKELVLHIYENASDRTSLINSLKVLLENKKRLVKIIMI